jgi:hypothetical protein
MPNESSKILGVIELTSQRARLPNCRRALTAKSLSVISNDEFLFEAAMTGDFQERCHSWAAI